MVKYEFVTGEIVEVEVSEELSEVIVEMEREEYNKIRRERRRHSSIEAMEELGFQFGDGRFDLEEIVEVREEIRGLYAAMETLLPKQRELVRKVYFEGKELSEIGCDEGVYRSAVHNRLKRIYQKLKKVLI